MNLDRYEKVDGREAIRRLLDGGEVYSKDGEWHRMDTHFNKLYFIPSITHHENLSPLTFNEIAGFDWYIPKPFDVRQAMLDRPNEWVGAFERQGRRWFVGFEEQRMTAVKTLGGCNDVNLSMPNVYTVQPSELDECTPIEGVPKEANQ